MTVLRPCTNAITALAALLLVHARHASAFNLPIEKQTRSNNHGCSFNVIKRRGLSQVESSRKNSFNTIILSPSTGPSKVLHSNLQNGEPCLAGTNVVSECEVVGSDSNDVNGDTQKIIPSQLKEGGTQTQFSAATNIGKCICGAGSFALPHVFLKEGVLGGTLAMAICALLASYTMQSLNNSRYNESLLLAATNKGSTAVEKVDTPPPPTSYVALAELALGKSASNLVFGLTLAASLGVCSTYIAFIGQTLSSLSSDAISDNIVHTLAPDVPATTWEAITAATVLPLSLVRNYGIFAFTSALGVSAVLGGILVTLAYGILVDPGGGITDALVAVTELKMWPDSFADAFGGSFGTIAYLFCVNFLTFPIMNSMKDAEKDFGGSVSMAVTAVWSVNIVFAIVCLGFYGDQTQDLVLQNLDNGPYLSALKILLCVDLLFTFPVVFSSGRQILENAILNDNSQETDMVGKVENKDTISLALSRAALTTGAVGTCFGLSQIGGFGVVANLIGGVAQGTLAFIVPPAIGISLSRRNKGAFDTSEIPQWLIASFGAVVVSSVTYFTFSESLS